MKKDFLNNYSKEELLEMIINYNEYQKECPVHEQLSIGSFVLSGAIARKYNKENIYPKVSTIEERLDKADKTEELREIFNKGLLRPQPRYHIHDFVEDTISNQFYMIEGIISKNDKIIYRLRKGPMKVEIEEKYLINIKPTKCISSKDGIIITEAKRL